MVGRLERVEARGKDYMVLDTIMDKTLQYFGYII